MVWRNGNVYSLSLSLCFFLSSFLTFFLSFSGSLLQLQRRLDVVQRQWHIGQFTLPKSCHVENEVRLANATRERAEDGRERERERKGNGDREGKINWRFSTGVDPQRVRGLTYCVQAPNQIFIDPFEGKMYRLTDRRGVPEVRAGTWPCSANLLLMGRETCPPPHTDVSPAQLTLRILGIFMKRRLETLSVFCL